MENLPSNSRRSRTNFINFDCPMCVAMGETPDRKKRCGISKSPDGLRISCFNCNFKTSFQLGKSFSQRFKNFLAELGLEEIEINRLNHRAFVLARILSDSNTDITPLIPIFIPRFKEVNLPPDTHPVTIWEENGLDDPDFLEVLSYVKSRGTEITKASYWSPEEKWKHRAIFPCRYRDQIVGWTGRLVHPASNDNPKYLNEVPANYLANCDIMNDFTRKYILMPEGFLDALVIDGISPFGAKLSAAQVNWIKESGKEVIIIPDRDKSGQHLIDHALANEWCVAFPCLTRGGNNWWEDDVKDCAEAVKRYGRLYTLRSILETKTSKRLEIEIKRKWLY